MYCQGDWQLKGPALRLGLTAPSGGTVDLTRRETPVACCKLNIDGAELRRLSGAAERRHAAEMLQFLLRRSAADLQRGPDRPGSNRVHPDPPSAQVASRAT
jgi:hypothetical protein